jgi:hypothetical protein
LSGPLRQPAHDHDPAALRQRLGGVHGLLPPHHHGVERRLAVAPASPSRILPDTATRKVARATPLVVWRSSGSSVRLPARKMLVSAMGAALL